MRVNLNIALIIAGFLGLTACKNSSSISLESTARKVSAVGSPYVQVNQGGRALIVENGKTASTGVHGWATVNNVAAPQLKDGGGNRAVLNRATVGSH